MALRSGGDLCEGELLSEAFELRNEVSDVSFGVASPLLGNTVPGFAGVATWPELPRRLEPVEVHDLRHSASVEGPAFS